jgi:chemotaxis protein CheX
MTQLENRNEATARVDLAAPIVQATCEVFSTMLGLEIHEKEACVEKIATAATSGVVSLVGLAGSWVGTGSICCSGQFACRIASALLMAEYESVNEDVLDSVAEITNMIIGNVKTVLEERLGAMGLSTPTVIFGKNFQTRSAGNNEWTVVSFESGSDTMHIQMCLVPNRDGASKTVRHGFLMPQLLNL